MANVFEEMTELLLRTIKGLNFNRACLMNINNFIYILLAFYMIENRESKIYENFIVLINREKMKLTLKISC